MKSTRFPRLVAAAIAAALLGAAFATPALARGYHHHGGPRVSFSFGFGVPYYAPYYYGPRAYYPYYPYPTVVSPVVVAPAPTTYVEQPQAAQLPAGQWYYCAESNAYYPYVQSCAGGWQAVSPTPAHSSVWQVSPSTSP